jgi:hypothetical protein
VREEARACFEGRLELEAVLLKLVWRALPICLLLLRFPFLSRLWRCRLEHCALEHFGNLEDESFAARTDFLVFAARLLLRTPFCLVARVCQKHSA